MTRPKNVPLAKGIQQARDRQKRDLERWPAKTLKGCKPDGFWFDSEAADHAVWFFSLLKHSKGEWAGQEFKLADWQEQDIIRVIFGWKRKDGTRRFRTAYTEVPRKNGKTTKAAGVGLYMTAGDQEPGAEVYSAATKKDQAKICHDIAVSMVKSSDQLSEFVGVLRNNIHCLNLGSKFEALGADADTLDGLNPSCAIIDESHAHKDRRVYDVLVTGMGARRQPLTYIITTAGTYDTESIGWELHDYAEKVLEGTIVDEHFFAFIAAADPEDDWKDPKTWYKANPNLGISVKEDYIASQCRKAVESIAFQNTFLRYHLNIWTSQVTRWLDMDVWKKCGNPVDENELKGRLCYGGLDLASKIDLTAFALVFPREGSYDVLMRFWLPEDDLKKRMARDRASYDRWAKAGFLELTPGNVVDYDFITKQVGRDAKMFSLQEVGFDPWNATQTAINLEEDHGIKMVEMRQGMFTLGGPTKELERLLRGGKIRHGNQPVLTWNASNVAVKVDENENMRPVKDKSTGRIDGIMALVMALGRAAFQEDDTSVYSKRGLITL